MKQVVSVLFLILTTLTMANAQQKALVIIDIQNDYFDGGKMPLVGSFEAVQKAQRVLEYFRAEKLPVVHIQHISNREGATFFLPGTFGAEIHEQVKPLGNEKVIEKHFPNSFIETELQSYLLLNDITELVVCGMMTSMCVDATVRAAKDLGYSCTVIADACAAPNLSFAGKEVGGKDVNTVIVGALGYYYATVVTADDFTRK